MRKKNQLPAGPLMYSTSSKRSSTGTLRELPDLRDVAGLRPQPHDLPDVHEGEFKGRHLQKVGIRELQLPIKVRMRDGSLQDTIGNISCYVNLSEEVRGANMSFFPILLYEQLAKDSIGTDLVRDILRRLKEVLSTKTFTPLASYVKIRFPVRLRVTAPVSGYGGYRWYECILEGRGTKVGDGMSTGVEEVHRLFLTVSVQTIATCPCSKELAIHLEGGGLGRSMPHQQRGMVTATVEYDPQNSVLVEDMVQWIESGLVAVPYPIIKRPDEQHVSKVAYDNAYFVEDAARIVGDRLEAEAGVGKGILDWVVVVNHYESIHQHVAVGIAYKGIEGGLR